MRKLALVLFLALAAAPLAVASSSIDYSTGNFLSGSVGGSFASQLFVIEKGTTATIIIDTGHLTQFTTGCPTHDMCFDFTGGSVDVRENGSSIFLDSLTGGITISGKGIGSINATLTDEAGVSAGAVVATFDFTKHKITAGSANVSFSQTTVPEPSELGFVGTGLLGLVILGKKLVRKTA